MDFRDSTLSALRPGMKIIYGGNKIAYVTPELAEAFIEGDRLVVAQADGQLLHIPSDVWRTARDAVTSATEAFEAMGLVSDEAITEFYLNFAENIEDDEVFKDILEANNADIQRTKSKGRSTTRLVLDDRMRQNMAAGLKTWADVPGGRGEITEQVEHDGWTIQSHRSGLGVIGFVFEGRPNVFADATGVIRSGNTVVFRIGSDALLTARAIMEHALKPALEKAGLPPGSASLVDTPSRAAGWAMFADDRLALAVARGSGTAVSQLGDVARQTGTPVSLHGTGGAWIIAAASADADKFRAAVYNSLDRKVCNTLNTCCIVAESAETLIPVFLDALHDAGERRGATSKLHVTENVMDHIPSEWRATAEVIRSVGTVVEPRTELLPDDGLGKEWEWEDSPEVSLTVVADVAEAIQLFNSQSPKFAASLISEEAEEHDSFFETIDSPFVGNGFTRWVDGQYALNRPELGLSNWQFGRLFGRSGILSGDSAYTIRMKATQDDPDVHR